MKTEFHKEHSLQPRPKTSIIVFAIALAAHLFNAVAPLAATPASDPCESKSQVSADWVAAQNEFAWTYFSPSLTQQASDTNFVYSPASLSSMLQMILLGADDTAKSEMLNALRAQNLDPTQFMLHLRNANDSLAKLKGITVREANSLWVNNSFSISPDYMRQLSALGQYLSAQNIDLDDSEAALQTINGWVREVSTVKDHKTGQATPLLQEVLKELGPDSATVMISTLLVDGQWEKLFNGETRYLFTNARERQEVKGYVGEIKGSHFSDERLEFISLPLADRRIVVDFIMPNPETDTTKLALDLANGGYVQLLTKAQRKLAQVMIPDLDFTTSVNLADDPIFRKSLGINAIFQAGHLTPMGSSQLKITQFKHDSRFKLTGTGVQAFGATAAVSALESVQPQPKVSFTANHPFWIIIRDTENNRFLFMASIQMGTDPIPGTLEKLAQAASVKTEQVAAPKEETQKPAVRDFVASDTTHYRTQSFVGADSPARKALEVIYKRQHGLIVKSTQVKLKDDEKIKIAEIVAALSQDTHVRRLILPNEVQEIAETLGKKAAPQFSDSPLEREALLDELIAPFAARSTEELDREVERLLLDMTRVRTELTDKSMMALLKNNYSTARRLTEVGLSEIIRKFFSPDYRGSRAEDIIAAGVSNAETFMRKGSEVTRQTRRNLYEVFARGGATMGKVVHLLKRDTAVGARCLEHELEEISKDLLIYAAQAQTKAKMDAIVDEAFAPYAFRDQSSVDRYVEDRIASLRRSSVNAAAISELLHRNHSALRQQHPDNVRQITDALLDPSNAYSVATVIYNTLATLPAPVPNFEKAALDSGVVPPNAPLRNQLRLMTEANFDAVREALLADPTIVGRVSYSNIGRMAHLINLDLQAKKNPDKALDDHLAGHAPASLQHLDYALLLELAELRKERSPNFGTKMTFILKKQHSLTRGLHDEAIRMLREGLLHASTRDFDTLALIEFILRTQIYPAFPARVE